MATMSDYPFQALASLWRHRHLASQMLRREVEGRYRGAWMGLAWSFIAPLFMLLIYTFVFSTIFRSRWPQSAWPESQAGFALIMFAGLSLFGLVQECLTKAHALVYSQPAYVKKVVFPLELLAWVQLGSGLVHLAIALVLLLVGQWLTNGSLPWTIILFPAAMLPLCLGLMGLMWLLAALGVYLRDIGQATGVLVGGLLFVSPVFYPVQAVPESVRWLLWINPLSYFIELGRDLLLWGRLPDIGDWLLACIVSLLVFGAGHFGFQRLRKGFADVL